MYCCKGKKNRKIKKKKKKTMNIRATENTNIGQKGITFKNNTPFRSWIKTTTIKSITYQ